MLSKQQSEMHNRVLDLVNSDKKLNIEQRFFIIENFQESATSLNKLSGAFFTPPELAQDLAVEIPHSANVVDLCAGIGTLSLLALINSKPKSLTCIELNEEYMKVGKRVLPEADWICGDVLSWEPLQTFDFCISNPPFGVIKTSSTNEVYSSNKFEYKVIEKASKISRMGAFILIQNSAGFKYSGLPSFEYVSNPQLEKFCKKTGISLEPSCGIDTSLYINQWKGTSPICEIVTCDFNEILAA